MGLEVDLYIENSLMTGGCAFNGGAIYMSGDSSLIVNALKVSECYAIMRGGAIFADGFNTFSVYGSSSFLSNFAN